MKNRKIDPRRLVRLAYDAERAAVYARNVQQLLAAELCEEHPSVIAAGEGVSWLAEAAALTAYAAEVRGGKIVIDADELRERLAVKLEAVHLETGLEERERRRS